MGDREVRRAASTTQRAFPLGEEADEKAAGSTQKLVEKVHGDAEQDAHNHEELGVEVLPDAGKAKPKKNAIDQAGLIGEHEENRSERHAEDGRPDEVSNQPGEVLREQFLLGRRACFGRMFSVLVSTHASRRLV
jgi:hypothetical protein